jgi:SAM-dependent methyltransferase
VIVEYDELVAQALETPFEGWDFGVFGGRFTGVEDALPWSYRDLVRQRLPQVSSLLDLGTGGGELLASLAPLPSRTAATEGYAPNVPVARRRLAPLGVEVAAVHDDTLPFPDGSFDLVVNRHESHAADEVRRVLVPGGQFITQQVSGRDLEEINEALGAPRNRYRDWDLETATAALTDVGFDIMWHGRAAVPAEFHDVGALVLFLRITPWQVPDFSVDRYAGRLRALHETMRSGRPLAVTCHRFALTARLP